MLYEQHTCRKCGGGLSGRQTVYCSQRCSKLYLKSQYRKRKRDKINEYNRNYRRAKPEVIKTQKIRHRSKKLLELGAFCNRCGVKEDLHMHHVRPRSMMGTDHASNMMVLCGECHRLWHYACDEVMERYWSGRAV
ncbi:HNH endonuclease [Candidatus Saccharibacteria bacterium]|nr:MAG: HNH endonuclease [Candidatus Saccharibacteria bacterium]